MLLEMSGFNPCVLRAALFDGYVGEEKRGGYAVRQVYDYELEYYTKSDGGITIDGRYIEFSPGDVNFRKPGQFVRGVPPYRCFIVCFDARGNAKRDEGYMFGSPCEAQPRYENPVLDALPDKISCAPDADMEHRFERVYHLSGAGDPLRGFSCRAALMDILSELVNQASPASRGISPEVRHVAREIDEKFAGELSVDALMDLSGLSRATFHRRFLREMGMTPLEMITRRRMARARELLLLTDYPIADVAALSGYPDNSYFTRVFRRECGLAPGEFRGRMTRPK